MNNWFWKVRVLIARSLGHPAFYLFSGAVSGIVFSIFSPSFLWLSLLIAGIAIPVVYGKKRWLEFKQLKWESMLLEEDFIA